MMNSDDHDSKNLNFKPRGITILRFWVLGFQGFATYPNFKILGFQGLATIKILRSWVSRVLRHNTILRSWVSRVPRQKGRARSKIHQGLRPWTQRTQDLEPFWNLGTSLVGTTRASEVGEMKRDATVDIGFSEGGASRLIREICEWGLGRGLARGVWGTGTGARGLGRGTEARGSMRGTGARGLGSWDCCEGFDEGD